MTATFLFVALLSYGNPYVMSLVVDRVSAANSPMCLRVTSQK